MKTTLKIDKRKKGDKIFFWGVLAYFIIHYFIFYVYVNFDSFLLAFQTYDLETKAYNFSQPFRNFERFFREFMGANNLFGKGIVLNLISYLVGLCIAMPITIYYSFLIYKKIPGSKAYRIILYAPAVIATSVWVLLYTQTVEVLIPSFFEQVFGKKIYGLFSNPDTAIYTLLVFGLWISPGTGTLMYIATMDGIPEEQCESMKMEGANSFQEFWHLTLPSIWPMLSLFLYTGAAGMFLGDLGLYTFYGEASPDHLRPFGYLISVLKYRAAQNVFDLPYIGAIAYFETLLSVPILFFAKWFVKKIGPSVD